MHKRKDKNSIIMIAAIAENNAIGKDHDLLWHLPDDFKRFKRLTTGHPIIMGRKTFETFPKPLPHRKHIIITRDATYSVHHPDCMVVHNFEDALDLVEEETTSYIIGGGEIYKLGIEIANLLEITRVHASFEADTYFPEIDHKKWMLIDEHYHPKDDKHLYDFTYKTFERIDKSTQ